MLTFIGLVSQMTRKVVKTKVGGALKYGYRYVDIERGVP